MWSDCSVLRAERKAIPGMKEERERERVTYTLGVSLGGLVCGGVDDGVQVFAHCLQFVHSRGDWGGGTAMHVQVVLDRHLRTHQQVEVVYTTTHTLTHVTSHHTADIQSNQTSTLSSQLFTTCFIHQQLIHCPMKVKERSMEFL